MLGFGVMILLEQCRIIVNEGRFARLGKFVNDGLLELLETIFIMG
jgi:hypothetical protein